MHERTRHPGAAAALAAALVLGGCSTCPRDPNQAGFFCGINNLATGVYREDTARLSDEADAAERQAASLRADRDRLQAEIAQLSGEERALRERQLRLNDELATQMDRVAELRRRQGADRARLAALDRQIADLGQRQRAVSAAPAAATDPATLRRLEAENQALQRQIDEIYQTLPR
jgi:septal ring factor EnvC (AmiA/AmiB activator)